MKKLIYILTPIICLFVSIGIANCTPKYPTTYTGVSGYVPSAVPGTTGGVSRYTVPSQDGLIYAIDWTQMSKARGQGPQKWEYHGRDAQNAASDNPWRSQYNNFKESGTTDGWTNGATPLLTMEASSTETQKGSYSIHGVVDANSDRMYYTFSTVIGGKYSLSFYYLVSNGSIGTELTVKAGEAENTDESGRLSNLRNTTWTLQQLEIIATATTTYITVIEGGINNNADFYIDNISITRDGYTTGIRGLDPPTYEISGSSRTYVGSGGGTGYGASVVADSSFDDACGVGWTCDSAWFLGGSSAYCDGSQSATNNLLESGVLSPYTRYKVYLKVSSVNSGNYRLLVGTVSTEWENTTGDRVYDVTTEASASTIYIQANSSFEGVIEYIYVRPIQPDSLLVTTNSNEIPLTYWPPNTTDMAFLDASAAVTNYAIWSTDLTAAGTWVYTFSGVSYQGTAPDGSETAYHLWENAGGAIEHTARQLIANAVFADNSIVTFSVYAQADTRNWISLGAKTKDNDDLRVYFNLSTGEIGTLAGVSSAYISKNTYNGFYRCSITYNIESAATDPRFLVSPATSDLGIVYAGDGSSGVTIWGPMVSQTSWLPPYIPTDSSIALYSSSSGMPYFGLPPDLEDMLVESLATPEIDDDASIDLTANYIIQIDATLAFDVDHYEIDYVGNTQHIKHNTALTPNKLFKLSVDVKDGTTAGVSGELRLTNVAVADEIGVPFTTAVGWATITMYAKTTSTVRYLTLYSTMTGAGNYEIKNILAEEVLNARTSSQTLLPPHGTLITYWVPFYDYGEGGSGVPTGGIIGSRAAATGILYGHKSGNIQTYDGTTGGVAIDEDWVAYRNYKLVVQWAYLDSNVSKYRIGVDNGSGMDWETWAVFDGSYTTSDNGFQFFAVGQGRALIGNTFLYNRILPDVEINAWGSP